MPEELPVKEKKQCAHDGCEKKLTAANESGYCSTHFYDSKRKSAAPVKETALARRREPQARARGGAIQRPLQSGRHGRIASFPRPVGRDVSSLASRGSGWLRSAVA